MSSPKKEIEDVEMEEKQS